MATDEQETLVPRPQDRKRAAGVDSLVRRGDSVSNGLAACIWPPGPLTPTWPKISFPKAYHPPVQARRGQLEPGAPCRRIHLAAYHRANACARHAIGANQHGLGRPFGAQPMPVPPSHLDFLAPIPRPPLESYCADIWAGQTRGNSTENPRCDCRGYPMRLCEWPLCPQCLSRYDLVASVLVKRLCDNNSGSHPSHQRFTSVVPGGYHA